MGAAQDEARLSTYSDPRWFQLEQHLSELVSDEIFLGTLSSAGSPDVWYSRHCSEYFLGLVPRFAIFQPTRPGSNHVVQLRFSNDRSFLMASS